MPEPRLYTRSEKLQKAKLTAAVLRQPEGSRAYQRALEGIDAINESAGQRHELESALWADRYAQARIDLSAARVAANCAPRGEERSAAKQAVKEAEKRLRAVEKARPKP
jgi:hypothetical protein